MELGRIIMNLGLHAMAAGKFMGTFVWHLQEIMLIDWKGKVSRLLNKLKNVVKQKKMS